MRAPYMAIIMRTACTMPHVRSCCSTIEAEKESGASEGLGLMQRTKPAPVLLSSSSKPESECENRSATVWNERPVPWRATSDRLCTSPSASNPETNVLLDVATARARSPKKVSRLRSRNSVAARGCIQ